MKCHIMWHFIWVFTVCKSTHLGVSCLQRVKRLRERMLLWFGYLECSSAAVRRTWHSWKAWAREAQGWRGRNYWEWLPWVGSSEKVWHLLYVQLASYLEQSPLIMMMISVTLLYQDYVQSPSGSSVLFRICDNLDFCTGSLNCWSHTQVKARQLACVPLCGHPGADIRYTTVSMRLKPLCSWCPSKKK